MGLHRTEHGENGCYSRWVPGRARMAMPGVLLEQSFMCSGRALHMKGTHAVLADNGFFWFGWRFGECWAFQVVI